MSRDSRSARLKGESAETLTVTTGDSAENIDLDSAFGFYMDVSYEASRPPEPG